MPWIKVTLAAPSKSDHWINTDHYLAMNRVDAIDTPRVKRDAKTQISGPAIDTLEVEETPEEIIKLISEATKVR